MATAQEFLQSGDETLGVSSAGQQTSEKSDEPLVPGIDDHFFWCWYFGAGNSACQLQILVMAQD